MFRVYYLKTCNTCNRIIKELDLPDHFQFQEIKEEEITVSDLDQLKNLSGSYEALFSKRAKLYKEMGLKDQSLSDEDYRHYILSHYTFVKRPIIVVGDTVFAGNSKKVIEAAYKAIHS
ncbi:MAG: hypothetical protein HKN00_02710 [Flavobacteriaceae bacterium]|nr:hypothetical protein [Bacteroidia bacterium]MBT8288886.1 hypothetical protein [Bacteroidia bacterium]NNF74069.1 hypothetical protein [Flavobacteriaceae bacterium]NNK73573.1 hypothetical protein [Flavobacteriaceae bacterium]